MTAPELAAIIDKVWDEIDQPAGRSADFAGIPHFLEALRKTRMFDEITTEFSALPETPPMLALASRSLCRGLFVGIHLGKAIREVEELEGLGR
jgi:hypothetical protein